MMEKGVSREHFQPRTCSVKNGPRTGQVKEESKNVIYIDVDNDEVDDVEILESPEFVPQNLRGSCGPSRDRTYTPQSVISIDDDDDDDDDDDGSDDADRPGIDDAKGVGELDSDACSSKKYSPASNSERNSMHVDVDDSRHAYGKDSVSNMDRSKKTFSTEATGRNRYGLYGSECESSDSDCSDCELMERDEWEKVTAKRRRRVVNDHEEYASSSGFHNNVYIDIDEENRYEPHAEVPIYPGPSHGKYVKQSQSSFSARDASQVEKLRCPKEKNCNFCNGVAGPSKFKENQSSFSSKDDGKVNGIHLNVETKSSFKDSDQKAKQSSKSRRSESREEMNSFRQSFDIKNKSSDVKNGERSSGEKVSGVAGPSKYKENQSSFSFKDDGKVGGIYVNVETKNSFKDSDLKAEQSSKSPRSESMDEMDSFRRSFDIKNQSSDKNGERTSGEKVAGPSKYKENQSSFSFKDDGQVDGIHFNVETTNSFNDSDQKAEQSSKSPRSEPIEEMHSFRQSFEIENRSSDTQNGERTRGEKVSPCVKGKNCDYDNGATGASRFKKDLGDEESKFMGVSSNACEMQVDNNESQLGSKDANLAEVNSNCASFDERHANGNELVLHGQDGGLSASNERNIINEKEKHKETDEYKQAIEEEWASRQRQLQIQAEEAQRLRKRKKAESQRILDMQRRQKERIEEVRESQKKDEESSNMKEQLRVEIRKRLNQLEMQCFDMTSLLRGLGIHVGGSFKPLPKEVHAAYKRALFKFHPDRASKTDIREQVEAEEKFKLVSRMKDKFLLTSCH